MLEIIYLDMDGVLADFDKRYRELFGEPPAKTSKKLWQKNWENFISGEHFKTLDWHSNGEKLYRGVSKYASENNIKIEILTSASSEFMIDNIAYQKRRWLLDRNIKHRYAHVVPGKRFKKEFADPTKLIIDDTESVILQFRGNGGHAIHHLGSAEQTLECLMSGTYAQI